jgi:hypothetical protein
MEEGRSIGEVRIGEQHVVDDGRFQIGRALAGGAERPVEGAQVVVDDRLPRQRDDAPVGRELKSLSRDVNTMPSRRLSMCPTPMCFLCLS